MRSPALVPAPARPKTPRPRTGVLLTTALCLLAGVAAAPAAAAASTSHARTASVHPAVDRTYVASTPLLKTNPSNPLAGQYWGTYKGNADPAWIPYESAHGQTRRALSYIADMPKAKWFGRWLNLGEIAGKVRDYIANATAGHPGALVQMTFFDVDPWEQEACSRLPSHHDVARYHTFINRAARAIGATHVALILQPDGPFAICAPHDSRAYSNMIAWAARRFNRQPNTSVYIDMGSADWMRGNVAKAVKILLRADVAAVRGFSMDVTHFDQPGHEVAFGARIVRALARHGLPNKHFVVDTADSGAGFSGKWWHAHHSPTANFNAAAPCKTKGQKRCVTLGIPPTTDVTNPKWGLSAKDRRLAGRYTDAFLWISRPWVNANGEVFQMSRALAEVRTTPFR